MKTLKLLNKFVWKVIFFCSVQILFFANANEPEDIWSKNNEDIEIKTEEIKLNNENKEIKEVYEGTELSEKIFLEENVLEDNSSLIGLYDPKDNDLKIDMWKNSDGDQVNYIIEKLFKMDLSNDAHDILKIAILTNSYIPGINMDQKKFNSYKINYLLKKKDLDLTKEFLLKNKTLENNHELIIQYVDYYLINGNLDKSCNLLGNNDLIFDNNYLEKFKIYCLINSDKRNEAQLYFDLNKEKGFKDKFFEDKYDYLLGYKEKVNIGTSEKSPLNFHLSHITDKNFSFDPNIDTPKFIWKYLSNYNLLTGVNSIDLQNGKKIEALEKAAHEKNYNEQELFSLYKRFEFTFNQLLTADETYKYLPNFEGRALLYQKILLTYDIEQKLKHSLELKKSFENDKLGNAYDQELSKLINSIELEDVPAQYTSFYNDNKKINVEYKNQIKFNNKIIHQSKLLNYFADVYDTEKTSKETNNLLKKIKADKKYVISNKDKILLDSLSYDGIQIQKKYKNIYSQNPNIPTDLQVLINNNDIGMILLRLSEIIGEDSIEALGTETLYFITSVLNQINLDKIRNKIILKILPIKV